MIKKEIFEKLFLAAHPWSFCKNVTVHVLNPNHDFLFIFFILGLAVLDSFDCLGSKMGNFIQDMKPDVWSNSAK